ncbi:branched-chain amino acid ABC transporter permease [Cytobacillus kochii]|uniref:branched-chain amino acid ABC transporter permease n=1 Tax=Cytobacillus kochii TaxID=859143 RepID=UPI00203A52AC|nr:branched-chain amino acid ABC transporter permease [Cytobacillus kochii]MCM3324103.1 branched-chain amino acid ABC transporter permease [Cytobacillus kochii]MCM3346493.1 branched-chain amino acid ABC transporter permease [Cytobacillus kochii]MDQ0187165.1 branched-chain amino acid transport system permease protein [Cytobacillus kochii]
MKKALLSTIFLLMTVLILPHIISPFMVYLSTEILVFAIFAMSLGLIMGFGGMPSLGHCALFGLGAYTVAILSEYTANIYLLLGAAILISLCFSLVTGYIAIRNKGVFFLMITLAFTQVLFLITSRMKFWGGNDGYSASVTANFGFGEITSNIGLFYMMGFFFVLTYFLLKLFVNAPAGKVLKGMMENEGRMIALGYNPKTYKMFAYLIAGSMAGLAGGLYIYKTQFVSPALFSVHMGAEVMIMVFIGGMGTIFGPALGAGAFVFLQNYISTMTDRWPLILGLIFIAIVLLKRGGILHLIQFVSTFGLKLFKSSRNAPVDKQVKGKEQAS